MLFLYFLNALYSEIKFLLMCCLFERPFVLWNYSDNKWSFLKSLFVKKKKNFFWNVN